MCFSADVARKRTNVYVDGFNLYNGLKRRANAKGVPNTEYRWIDIVELVRLLLPDDHIGTVRYFTALVKPREDNPGVEKRQEIFLRALETRGDVVIERGSSNETRLAVRLLPSPRPLWK